MWGVNLGRHFAQAGHQVMFSSRHPEKLTKLVERAGENAQRGTVDEAIVFGDVLLLAIPFGKTPDTAQAVGNRADGKVLIDATNYYWMRDGREAGKAMKADHLRESQWTARHFSQATIIKAFNTISDYNIKAQAFGEQGKTFALPYATDASEAKEIIEDLMRSIGFRGVYVGSLVESQVMEPDQLLYGFEGDQAAVEAQLS